MGKGSMMNVFRKLGLVTKSSTETEEAFCGERFPKCTWFRSFRMAQGDSEKENALMQENKSCIMFHENYPFSIGKGTKHAHVRCFFVVEKIEKKELKVACCPTDKMIADYRSKPTRGSLLVYQRNVIQGVDEKHVPLCERWCKRFLEKCELWDDLEDDLSRT